MPLRMFIVNEGSLELLQKPVFTSGDAYLVVDETAKKIWVWLGKDCSVDEKGTAAVEARRIDDGDVFHGAAQIITIDQGDEPAEFLGKLKGLIILDKNKAKSMLKDVTTGEFAEQANHVNALYRVSSEEYEGINAMKYLQVPFEKASLDSEDCFVADLGVDIWIWQGNDCNVKEKVKAMQIAREFDADRAGDQRPKVFMESDDAEFMGIFEGRLPHADRETIDFKPDAPATPEKPKMPPSPKIPESIPEVKTTPAPKSSGATPTASQPSKSPKPSHSEVTLGQKDLQVDSDGMLIQKSGGRLKCPKCGNDQYNMIREVDDKTKMIMDYPRIYGKKYICGECGAEWRKIEE